MFSFSCTAYVASCESPPPFVTVGFALVFLGLSPLLPLLASCVTFTFRLPSLFRLHLLSVPIQLLLRLISLLAGLSRALSCILLDFVFRLSVSRASSLSLPVACNEGISDLGLT